jgi:hypothetical protein
VPGADTLVGNGLKDTLDGGEGANGIGGDGVSDVLIGAPGQDTFVLTSSAAAPAVDLIWNFELGTDFIEGTFGDPLNRWANATASFMSDYAFTEPDGTISHLSGTLLSSSDRTGVGFLAGEDLTMAQLTANNALL